MHCGLDKRCGSITVIQKVLCERPGFQSGLVHSVHSQPPIEDRKIKLGFKNECKLLK